MAWARRHGESAKARQRRADEELRRMIASRFGVRSPERFSVHRLRVQRHPVIRQTDERIARLRGHLQVLSEEAFASPLGADRGRASARNAVVAASQPPSSPELDRACGVACSLCKGDCCLSGEERLAYLTVDTIGGWRLQRPEATADEIVAEYLSFVPRKATAGGCFYQAGTGCTLPREMRSDVCNRYFCDELQQFRAEASVAAQTRQGDSSKDRATVRAFFVVTLPNGRRQTRFHESPIA